MHNDHSPPSKPKISEPTAPGRVVAAGLIALVSALAAPRAWAGPAIEPIVLEARSGPRPADADRLLGPVLAELARSGFAGPHDVATRIDQALSRASRALADDEAAAAVRAIEGGYKQFLAGKFDAAVQEIERGLDQLRAAPAALAGKNDRRDAVMRGLVGLALANKRRGREALAAEAMKELVRSFPDREVSYTSYGPEPREFFDAVRRDLGRDGKGSIAVDVDDDRTVVFLNERYAGVGDVVISDLYPGSYRVFLQQGDQFGRVHDVVVEPGVKSTVSLSWQLDAALRTGGAAALVFADPAARLEIAPRGRCGWRARSAHRASWWSASARTAGAARWWARSTPPIRQGRCEAARSRSSRSSRARSGSRRWPACSPAMTRRPGWSRRSRTTATTRTQPGALRLEAARAPPAAASAIRETVAGRSAPGSG